MSNYDAYLYSPYHRRYEEEARYERYVEACDAADELPTEVGYERWVENMEGRY